MPDHLDVRLSPEGRVAQRQPGDIGWLLATYDHETGLNATVLTDEQVTGWPRLDLAYGRTDPPSGPGARVHYTPRDTGERAPACVDAKVTAVDVAGGSRWVGLDCLGEGERANLDAGATDAGGPTCDGLWHAPGTWHWPAQ